jgi:membrane protease YdiL (CAAX protease family)
MVFPAVTAILLVAYNTWTNLAIARYRPDRWYVLRNLALSALLLGAAAAFGYTTPELGLGMDAVGRGAIWGAVSALLVVVAVTAFATWRRTRPWFDDARLQGMTRAAGLRYAFVRVPFGTVVLEEIGFRGVLFGAWASASGDTMAMIGSAAVFGLWHIGPTWVAADLNGVTGRRRLAAWIAAGVVATFGAGIVLAWLRVQSGSLLAPALLHGAANVAASVAGLRVTGSSARAAP